MPTRPRPASPGALRRGPSARDRVSRSAPTALVLALLVALLTAAPASAHARFTGADPAEGAELGTLPAAVVLSYSEDVAPQFVDAAVVTPDGTTLPTSSSASGADVTVDLSGADVAAAAGQGGSWQVVARVVSVDGHPVEHTTTFTVAAADQPSAPAASAGAPVEPTTEPAGSPEPGAEPGAEGATAAVDPVAAATDGLPRWAVVLGAVALVAAAAAAVVVQLRRRPPTG